MSELNEKINLKTTNDLILISNQKERLLTNLLYLNPTITHFSILHPDFMLPRLTEENLKKFKIVLYDLNDGRYNSTTTTEELRKYLINGRNIILTHALD